MIKVNIKSIQSINFIPTSDNSLPTIEVDELVLSNWCKNIENFKKTQAEILAAMNAAYGKDGS